MKNILKRGLALLLIVMIIVSSISISSFAAVSRPQANTGIRDEVCTTFNGTTAPAYYTGTYSYANLSTLSASTLKSTLATLMTSTHKNTSTYDNCRDYAPYTDCEGGDTSHFTMLYTSYSATYSQYNSGQGWNREHVWPKSLGGGGTSGGGADLHHIRPDEAKTNSTRNDRKYGNVANKSTAIGNLSGAIGGYYGGNNLYEPLDNVKGDVARICLYVYVRWGSSWGATDITKVFQSVDVLLEWCALDPVDTWEMERNDVVQGVQGNRNVFIDYPELAWMIFGKSVPSDLVSPSDGLPNGTVSGGGSQGGNTGGGNTGSGTQGGTATCTHASTTTVNAATATCGTPGYTGDSKCVSCGVIVSSGTSIPATNNHTEITLNAKEATCIDGYTGDTKCTVCGKEITKGQAIPADKDHIFDVWMEVTPATETASGIASRHCFICGFGEVETIPKIAKPVKTDDTTPIIIVSIVTPVVLAGVGVALFFILKKKKS